MGTRGIAGRVVRVVARVCGGELIWGFVGVFVARPQRHRLATQPKHLSFGGATLPRLEGGNDDAPAGLARQRIELAVVAGVVARVLLRPVAAKVAEGDGDAALQFEEPVQESHD
jgi:hypothetical protein